MTTFNTNSTNSKLNAFNTFRNQHGDGNNGFESMELAIQFSKLKSDWWGSNLVILETKIKDGRFFPQFNVFD